MKSVVLIDVEDQPQHITDHYYITNKTEPLGLLYLESFLNANGIDVSVFKMPLSQKDWMIIKNAEIVGLSGLTYCWQTLKKLSRDIKETNYNAFIVVGREHASLTPYKTLQEKNINAIVVGEGEYGLLKLAQGVKLEDIPSLIYKSQSGEIIKNTNRRYITSDELFPLKRRENWMRNMLHETAFQYSKMAGITLSRGCVFRCDFCTAPKMWCKYRDLNIWHALNEVNTIINKFNINYFAFHDLMLNTKPQRLNKFCIEIINKKINANFFAMMSVNCTQIDFSLLKKAGFNEIGIGIEIPSNKRTEIGKYYSFNKTKKLLHAIHMAGIFIRAYIIIGFPWEKSKNELIDEYTNALKDLPINALRIHFLTPFPGTKIFNKYEKYCIYQPIETGYNHFTTMEPVLKFNLSSYELIEARSAIIKNYYYSNEYMRLTKNQEQLKNIKEMNQAFYEHMDKNLILNAACF